MNPHKLTFQGGTNEWPGRLTGCKENLDNMTAKSLVIAGVLTLSSLSVASAKSFDVVLSQRAMAGNTELKAGEYRLKAEGSQAVFTDARDYRSITVPVKIENGTRKFGQTAVESTSENGMENIRIIENIRNRFGRLYNQG